MNGLSQDVKRYKSVQKMRLAWREQIRAVEQGRADLDVGRIRIWHDQLHAIEKDIAKSIELLAKLHPLWTEWLCHVRGIGLLGFAQLMGEIMSVKGHNGESGIGAFEAVSSLWQFAGIGRPGQKPEKGKPLGYNARLKTICLEFIGGCIIRANGAYRRLYDEKKAYYQITHADDWTPLHIHYAARRFMVKVFLSHFWEKWRLLEGYPIRLLYVIEKLGHSHLYDWREFVEVKELELMPA